MRLCVRESEMLTYEGLFGDDVLCHLEENVKTYRSTKHSGKRNEERNKVKKHHYQHPATQEREQ